MPDFGKVGSLSNFYLGAQTIQRGKLLFRFSSRCANYSRERSNQGGILFKEIRYIVITRKYPLRGYILGPPGWPESIFSAGLGLTFFSYSHFGKVSTQLLGSRQGSACVDHPTVKIEYT